MKKWYWLIFLPLSACRPSHHSSNIEKIAMADTPNTPKVYKTDAEWQQILDPESFRILRQNGTEYPYSGKYDKFYEPGKYYCKGCHAYLFSSDTKYNSGCGWPAFYDVQKDAIRYIEDLSHGMRRVEVRCATCDGHLGHVFEDGPRDKTGLRYCINSVAMEFEPLEK